MKKIFKKKNYPTNLYKRKNQKMKKNNWQMNSIKPNKNQKFRKKKDVALFIDINI